MLNITAVKVRKRSASMQRKIISIMVTGGEKSLHSDTEQQHSNIMNHRRLQPQQSRPSFHIHHCQRKLNLCLYWRFKVLQKRTLTEVNRK